MQAHLFTFSSIKRHLRSSSRPLTANMYSLPPSQWPGSFARLGSNNKHDWRGQVGINWSLPRIIIISQDNKWNSVSFEELLRFNRRVLSVQQHDWTPNVLVTAWSPRMKISVCASPFPSFIHPALSFLSNRYTETLLNIWREWMVGGRTSRSSSSFIKNFNKSQATLSHRASRTDLFGK